MSSYIVSVPNLESLTQAVTDSVIEGVTCGVFKTGDPTYDYGLITIEHDCSTPEQEVMEIGSLILEVYLGKGEGVLRIKRAGIDVEYYHFSPAETPIGTAVEVYFGDTIQWLNWGDEPLNVLEEHHPKFNEKRFKNIIKNAL